MSLIKSIIGLSTGAFLLATQGCASLNDLPPYQDPCTCPKAAAKYKSHHQTQIKAADAWVAKDDLYTVPPAQPPRKKRIGSAPPPPDISGGIGIGGVF